MTIQLSKGVVTRSRCYISYKTDMYGDYINFYIKLFDELKKHLDENGVNISFDEAQMIKSFNSNCRKGCITILVCITEDIKKHQYLDNITFQEDPIN